jgi:hypothetical protein
MGVDFDEDVEKFVQVLAAFLASDVPRVRRRRDAAPGAEPASATLAGDGSSLRVRATKTSERRLWSSRLRGIWPDTHANVPSMSSIVFPHLGQNTHR